MELGKLYYYKKTEKSKSKLVLITSGQYLVDGRVSNFWNFAYIKDGNVSASFSGDYDNENWKFKKVPDKLYTLKVIMSEENKK